MDVMNWPQLLCAERLGASKSVSHDPSRSAYTIDSDRIIFSSAFRRLQDKTQVFPLSDNDYVHTRLTHSLEVASVGRSLGIRVGAELKKRYAEELADFHESDFGAIVYAAALAHDLGNPPFGHSGEDTIRDWFKNSKVAQFYREKLSPAEIADFENFEGNAQGFRIVTHLQMPDNPGLKLTCATLAAFTKYPRESILPLAEKPKGISAKKFGFYQSEKDNFTTVAGKTGLLRRDPNTAWWCRHPLAYLVEAADDICYGLIDYEDGFRLGHLTYEQVAESFLRVTGDPKDRERAGRMKEKKNAIAFLRAQSIGAAVQQTTDAFLKNEEAMRKGTFDEELLGHLESGQELKQIKKHSIETIYSTQAGVMIEVAGYEILQSLLDDFAGAVDDIARNGSSGANPRSRKLIQLIPGQFLGDERQPDANAYSRLLKITDFISGMTDTYATNLSRRIKMPGR